MMELKKLEPGLYIVATPIGNLKDITIRALETLKAADLIICEDTRVTQRLLAEYNIEKKLFAYNDHNGEGMRPKILGWLQKGQAIALVSDAGTPLISDPGYKLALEVREQGFYTTSLPGPCSPITALTLSNLASDSFLFDGFLPAKSGARKNRLKELQQLKSTLIFFDRASRLLETIKDINEVLGNRKVAIARELSKKFEEVLHGKAADLMASLPEKDNLLGEIVLLVEGFDKAALEFDFKDVDKEIAKLKQQNVRPKIISEILSKKYPLTKKQIYARITNPE